MTSTASSSLQLLGRFALRVGGREIAGLPRKAQALLAYLALQPDRRASREMLADLLWTESSQEQARHSLRQLLVVLRRTAAGSLIGSDADKVWLDADAMCVDALAFEADMADGSPQALLRAAERNSGPLLDNLPPVSPAFEEWLRPQRARVAGLVAQVLHRFAAAQRESGAFEAATATASRLVAMDTLDEAAHRLLIDCLARAGQRSRALQQFDRCVRTLREELDVAPDAETVALAECIRAGDGCPGGAGTMFAAGAGLQRDVAVAPVETVLPPAMAETVATSPAVVPSTAAPSWRPLAARFAWAAVVAGLILLSAGAFALWPSSRLAPAIAVARFHNVTGTAAQDIADAGFADLVKLRLATEQHLRLAGDTGAETDNAPAADPVERRTQPRYRLDGTVAFDTSEMHVTARLVDLRNGTELWSDRYDSPTADAARVADDIAIHAARAVSPDRNIVVAVPRPPFADPRRAGRELDALGFQMDYYKSTTDAGAQSLYRLALTFDRNNVSALTHLATSYIRVALTSGRNDSAALAQADASLAHAVALDPRNAFVLYNACLLRRLEGHATEAIGLCRRALDIDPRFPPALRELGHDLLEAGDATQAIASYRAAIEAGPYLPLTYNAFKGLGIALWAEGFRTDAVAALEQSTKLDANHEDDEQLWLAAMLEIDGKDSEARQMLGAFMARHPGFRINGDYLRLLSAPIYADRRNEVLAALTRTTALRSNPGANTQPR